MLRHGKTGLSGKYVGSQDVKLSSEGVSQIEQLKGEFTTYPVDIIVSSPMTRCRQCSDILFPNQAICYEEDLREIDFGRWEMLSFQEIVNNDPQYVDAWSNWSTNFSFPEGESIGSFVKRIERIGKKITQYPETNILVITHGGVIRTLLCHFLRLDPSQYLLFNVHKGCYTTLDLFHDGAVLTGFNLGATKS